MKKVNFNKALIFVLLVFEIIMVTEKNQFFENRRNSIISLYSN